MLAKCLVNCKLHAQNAIYQSVKLQDSLMSNFSWKNGWKMIFFAGKNLRKEEIDTSLLDGCVHAYPDVIFRDQMLLKY